MGIINVSGISLYAYHGCLDEEAIIGGQYSVDVKIETDFSKAEHTDNLRDTVDYVAVYNLVKRVMQIRCKLIEHVAGNISDELIRQFPSIEKAEVTVVKINPPMNGDVKQVSVTIIAKRT